MYTCGARRATCGVCHRANTTLYTDTEHRRTTKGSPTTLPHEAGLAQRPELRRDARLHRLDADAAEVVAVRAHLLVEAGRALRCPGSFQKGEGPREVAKASRGRAAAMAPLRSDGGGRSVAATRANLAGVPTTGQRANQRARGTGRDPARRSRIIPRAGPTFEPPVPPPRYRPPPSIALWARARDGTPALDAGSCRRPSRRRAW